MRLYFLCGVMALSAFGCKPKQGSSTKAIVSADGKNAMGLLAVRQSFEYGVDLPPGTSSIVENAMRTTYAAVECFGDDSAKLFNVLEDVTRYGVEGLKREGSTLVIPTRSLKEAVLMTTSPKIFEATTKYFKPLRSNQLTLDKTACAIQGDSTMSAASFVLLMAKSSVDYDTKQLIWLAARGRADTNISKFSAPFLRFLRENLGATPIKSSADSDRVLKNIDKQFNPCLGAVKGELYKCDSNKNYEVSTAEYKRLMVKFLRVVKDSNESYLQTLASQGADGKDASIGLRIAASVNQTIKDSDILKTKFEQDSNTKAPFPSKESIKNIHPSLAIMMPHLPKIQEYFQIRFGAQPGNVIDSENPAAIHVAKKNSTNVALTEMALDDEPQLALGDSQATAAPNSGATNSQPSSSSAGSAAGSASTGTSPTSTVPPQAEPVKMQSIIPLNNTQNNLQAKGDEQFWKRDDKNPNQFRSATAADGSYWESKAVKTSTGATSYHNVRYGKDGAVLRDTVMFNGANDLVGGAAKNTFVEYDVPKDEKIDFASTGYFQNKKGNVLSVNNGKQEWLNFDTFNQDSKDAGIAGKDIVMQGKAVVFDDKGQKMEREVKDVNASIYPFRFYDRSGGARYLADVKAGNNEPLGAWVIPEVSTQKEEIKQEIAVRMDERKDVVQQLDTLDRTSDLVERKSQSTQLSESMAQGKAMEPGVKAIVKKYEGLEESFDKLNELQSESAPDKDKISQKRVEIAEKELEIAEAERQEAALRQVPAPGKKASTQHSRLFDEHEKKLKEQQELVELEKKRASETEILRKQLLIEEKNVQIALREKELFNEKNGQPVASAGILQRWNPFGRPYDYEGAKAYDRWTKAQRDRFNEIHRRQTSAEERMADLDNKIRTLQTKKAPSAVFIRSDS